MKIHLCKSHFAGPISGADETLVAYALHLHHRGHQVTVVVLHPSRDDLHYRARLAEAGVDVVTIATYDLVEPVVALVRTTALSTLRVLRLGDRSRRLVRRTGHRVSQWIFHAIYSRLCRSYFQRSAAEVMHVVTPDHGAATLIRAGAAEGIPVFYQELGAPHDVTDPFRAVLPLCSEIAVLSPGLASEWRGAIHTRPVSVVPLLIEEISHDRVRQPAGPGTTFGFAARMEPGKGPLPLVEAFARVHRQRPDAALTMAGSGRQRSEAIALARALGVSGHCSFPGSYSSPAGRSAFMGAVDVFVLPTLSEGTPNSIIEAMAAGLPVIASAVGGIPDLVTPDTGVLVAPGDTEELADAMLRVASDRASRARMGRAARARYEELFSTDVVLSTLVDAYHRTSRRTRQAPPAQANLEHPWSRVGEL